MATRSGSDLNESVLGGSDIELKPSLLDKDGISRIFIDAVQYGEVISEQIDGDSRTSGKSDIDEDGDLGVSQQYESDGTSVRNRLVDLIGRDFSTSELAASERFAKFAVMKEGSIRPLDEVDSPLNGVSGSELEAVDDDERLHEGDYSILPEPGLVDGEATFEKRPSTSSVSQLSPEQIVDLLIDEFGPLTVNEDDKERLIWEMDGGYLQEVAILGMIHLTTHRITFHASLLSTRPDLFPEKQLIRDGPVTIHRSGWRRKRRVWLELSHDMLTAFPSSKEEDRIRPLRSCLLSTIKKVYPEDENNRRLVRLEFFGKQLRDAEFDTEESARQWRREIQGAIFVYRRGRASCLNAKSDDEMRGVQISIPLSRIRTFSTRMVLKFATLLKIELSSGKVQASMANTDSDSETGDKDKDSMPSSDEYESDMYEGTIELGVTQSTVIWDDLGQWVKEARDRELRAGIKVPPQAIIDFGALSFVEVQSNNGNIADKMENSIRCALALGEEGDIWYTRARISRSIASNGYFAVSKHYIAFWSKCLSIRDAKYRFPMRKVVGAQPNHRYMPRTFGMILEMKEHPSMHFVFSSEVQRDEAIRRVEEAVKAHQACKTSHDSFTLDANSPRSALQSTITGAIVSASPKPLRSPSCTSSPTMSSSSSNHFPTPLATASHVLAPLARTIHRASSKVFRPGEIPHLPKVINLPSDTLPRSHSMHFVCLTIGSRGDVQPYIALGQALLREGHRVTIVTHGEYKSWVEGWGIAHRTAGGDPGALMKLSVEHKMFSPQFFKESLGNFRAWLDDLLVDAWECCKDADVLLESPSAMAGVHIAEALDIPYFRTFTMPWTKTTEFPHPFLSPPVDLAHFNASTYILFDNIFWTSTAGQINRWRRNTLHIGNTDMDHLAQSRIPFIYNFSPSVVPKPLDWEDQITISGYWFLDNPDLDWTPPESLLQWMNKARKDEKAIVYIGFGSITVPDPPALTRRIVRAVKESGVRAIISKGWSARMAKSDEPEFIFPPECYSIDKIPHDWLFPRVDAALHHGGAGTTGASLRAGIPTLIKPWFGDQFFWASRVQKIGAGMKISSLNSSEIANALISATTDRTMKERAASVGEKIRQENGTQNALHAIYVYLNRAGRVRRERPN